MKTLLIGLSILGLTHLSHAQKPESHVNKVHLEEIVVSPMKNGDYYASVHDPHASSKVGLLEEQARNFDIKTLDFYNTTFDYYEIMFTTNEGEVIAVYDDNGDLVKAVEKFEDVQLPEDVRKTLSRDYPEWRLNSTVYRVHYYNNKADKKIYNIQLKKDGDKINLKIDCKGAILHSSE